MINCKSLQLQKDTFGSIYFDFVHFSQSGLAVLSACCIVVWQKWLLVQSGIQANLQLRRLHQNKMCFHLGLYGQSHVKYISCTVRNVNWGSQLSFTPFSPFSLFTFFPLFLYLFFFFSHSLYFFFFPYTSPSST